MKAKKEDTVDLLIKAKIAEYYNRAKEGDFWAYCLFMDMIFFNKRKVLKKVAEAYQMVFDAYKNGKSIKIAVSLPPRAGKSYITTLFATFMLGHFPNGSVMRNSVSAPLYNKFSYDAREIVKSLKFRVIFPEVELSPTRQNIDGWYLKGASQPSYFGGGVEGTIIGFGANMLAITDDLFKSFEEALSPTINEKTWRWKQGTHDSRTEKNCCEIDIGTRWSKDDVIGRLEAANHYDKVIRIPALDENDKSFCEDVHSTEFYLKKRNTVDEIMFQAEYMQQPIEQSGLLFPRDELQFFEMEDIKGMKPIAIIGVCDSADKGTDYFSAPIAYLMSDNKFYIVDVVFTSDNIEITGPLLVGMITTYRPQKFLVESNNGGRIFSVYLERDLKGKSQTIIEARPTVQNKSTRILMRSGYIKNNFVFRSDVPEGSQYSKFINNLVTYLKQGTSKHDDAPDSLTILAEYIEFLGLDTYNRNTDERIITKSSLGLL